MENNLLLKQMTEQASGLMAGAELMLKNLSDNSLFENLSEEQKKQFKKATDELLKNKLKLQKIIKEI